MLDKRVLVIHGEGFQRSALYKALFTAWRCNYMPSIVSEEITYPFTNFNVYTIEVAKGMRNFIPYFAMNVIDYPCYDQNYSMFVEGVLRSQKISENENMLYFRNIQQVMGYCIIPSTHFGKHIIEYNPSLLSLLFPTPVLCGTRLSF